MAAERAYGYGRNELLGLTIRDLRAPETRDLTTAQMAEADARGILFETIHRRKDGCTFPVEVSSKGATINGNKTLISVVRDIAERRQAEERLRASEQKFKAAFMTGLDGVYIATLEDGRAIEVNDEFEKLFGYAREELIGRTSPELNLYCDPSDRATIVSELMARGRIKDFEAKGRKKNGQVMTISLSASVMHVGGVPYILGVIRDITERKRVEEKLRESALQLSEAADLARIAYWEYDEATGEFIFNDAFYDLYGTSAEQEGGYRMAKSEYGKRFVHPDDLPLYHQGLEKSTLRPGPELVADIEHRIVRRDGEVRHILVRISIAKDDSGRIVERYGTNQDITERKKAQEQLKEKEERFRKIFEESLLGIVIVGSDHRFARANAAFCGMLGYTERELTALTFKDITHPEHIAEDMLRVHQLASGEISVYRTEKRYLRKDKAIVWGSSTVTVVRDGSGEFLYFLTMVENITQRKQAEEEKARLEAQLRQAQKMEAIGTLAGGVAHDFNNILMVIMGLGSVIQMTVGPDDRIKPYIDQIVLSSERAADLTQSLLAFSRKQRITLEPHKVNTVVAGTAKLLKRLLTEDIILKVDLTDDHAIAMLDVSQMDQVLMNLATNARDAMPNGGSLTIRTDVTTLDETFKKTHGFGRPGTYAHLSVWDSGIGMDEKTMARIFDPFFTTKEVGKGTGLGLASVYGIVKQHGGYITVRSQLFKGTTFDIYLPLVEATVQQPAVTSVALQGGSETILVLEDDRDVRNMMTKILSNQGYIALEAANGDDAIRVFEEHKEKIKLVILDVVMPGKNGREVFDEINRIEPKAKAIFMSGYTGDIVIDKGIQKEDVEFLQKPLSVAKLLAKVREVLDR